ncbi:MKRN2 opposite strand protein-like [Oculina patagonica]
MSEATEDAVLCMQHCTNQTNIFFTKFPETCPLCGISLKCCSLIIPPFRVPSPFVSQNNVSCVLLVKPTKGSFLRDYKSGDDLHVGIAASNGKVYNFDERGLHADGTDWEQCIAVSVDDIYVSSPEDWDSKLQQMYCSGQWTSKEYDEHSNNCYDFTLSFLNQFLPTNKKPFQKPDFCKDFIVPWTTKAAYYIDLYRRVQQGGGVSVERSRWT